MPTLLHSRVRAPFSPLMDLWSFNYAFLAQNFDLSASQAMPTPNMGLFDHVGDKWVGTLLINDWAAFAYLRDCNPRDTNNNINVSHLKGTVKQIRKKSTTS
jgi:hypothetical protein